MVRADAGGVRTRVVDRSRQRDPSGRSAEAEDRRPRRPAPAPFAAGEAVSADLDTVSGRAGYPATVAAPTQAGDEPGGVPEEKAVHGAGARGVGKTLTRSMGQTAVPGVVRDARSAEHGDRRTGPSGATTSREPRGSRTPDEASRRGTGDRTGVRVDPGTGDTLPEEQTRGELSRTESEGTLQRR